MSRTTWILIVLGAALTLYAAFSARATWIKEKIAALSAPPSSLYASANAKLPPKGANPRVVLIGDSRIAQWPTAALAEKWEIISRGIGGETTHQLALRFFTDAIALDPDIIVIEAGINDLVAASFMDDASKLVVASNTDKTLRQLADQATTSGRQTLVATIIPSARPEIWRLPVWSESLIDLVAEVNASLKQAQLPDRARLIDLSSVVSTDNKTLSDSYRLDTLHLNEAGYVRLTAALIRDLESALNARQSNPR